MLNLVNKLVGIIMGFIALSVNYQVWQGHLKSSDNKFRNGFFMLLNNQEWVCFKRTHHYRSYYSLITGEVLVIDIYNNKKKIHYPHIFSYYHNGFLKIDYHPAFI
jgi:hypothetical protein